MISEKKRQYLRDYYKNNKHRRKKRTPEKQAEYNATRRERYKNDDAMRKYYVAMTAEWRRNNPGKRNISDRLRMYGLTDEAFMRLMEKQDNKCGICQTLFGNKVKMHVDHDHKTGLVRGILCGHCNLGIGKFGDSPEHLRAAAAYLERNV